VRFVDDQHHAASPFVLFGRQQVVGLGDQLRTRQARSSA
jgi:hypothetical protein